MRKFVGSALVVLVALAVATAEEFTGSVTKIEDGKITVRKFGKGGKGGKAEEVTLSLASNVKYLKAKFNKESKKVEADGNLEGGKEAFEKLVKDAAAKKGDDKTKGKKGGFGFGGGQFAQIVTEGEGENAKVTEIRVFQFGGGKKKDAE